MVDVLKTVDLRKLTPQMVLAVVMANEVFAKYGEHLTLTSVSDGKHMSGSFHYVGNAVDIRLPIHSPTLVMAGLLRSLGSQYDVVLEKSHIHIEFDPD